MPTAALDWGSGALALGVLSLLVVAIALVGPLLLRHPVTGVGCCLVLASWLSCGRRPPAGRRLAGCWWRATWARATRWCSTPVAERQSSSTAGRTRSPSTDCLDRLGVEEVPLVVLTHFHADHVDGLSGVLDDRAVGEVETTGLLDPPGGVREVESVAGSPAWCPLPRRTARPVGSVP